MIFLAEGVHWVEHKVENHRPWVCGSSPAGGRCLHLFLRGAASPDKNLVITSTEGLYMFVHSLDAFVTILSTIGITTQHDLGRQPQSLTRKKIVYVSKQLPEFCAFMLAKLEAGDLKYLSIISS